ncbi:ABC transporter substrate-binding protein [Roseibacterium beibuensis]|uniref:ABC transporter substrate-binding protein n=1 Tax=[Roseibacterium] beibuensis TaxID=1193142 RepID=A0ABP9L5C1_9RHOB|nr:ABC transporter substrate-binding protein [Roseibacterium beibuensis]MCS6621444.1 ABC transporter substrate-binding protein [Roseibacterium beibuensis]
MKKILLASAATMAMTGGAFAEAHGGGEVPLGILLSFTGPIESLVPPIAGGAELAIAEVNESGAFMDGMTVTAVRADTFCSDAAGATANAERVITTEGVVGIMGSDCSGMSSAILANVAVPNGVPMISPASTSPALSSAEDNGLFFRTAPSDARQGEVLAGLLLERGIESIAITYTNNDYGQGFADALQAAYEEAGGEVTLVAAHEDGRADYSAEVGALASAGGDVLVVLGYVDQGGSGVVQAALDTGAFDTFAFGDGMVGDTLAEIFGGDIDGSFGTAPGAQGDGVAMYQAAAEGADFDNTSVFSAEAYDAAALLMLAMQAAGSTVGTEYAPSIMDVANAPGEPIMPGELGRALEILAEGGEIDYQGATGVEMIGAGEAAGSYRVVEMQDGVLETVEYR